MVRVEGDFTESRRHHTVEGESEERLVKDGNEGLGEDVGERGETGAESCGQR